MDKVPEEPTEPQIIEGEVKPLQGEIVNPKAGEIIPRGVNEEVMSTGVSLEMVKMESIGSLVVSDDARKVLEEPLDPNDVLILSKNGAVYLPWTFYAERLNRAFGKFKWGLIPAGMPKSQPAGPKQVLVVWGHWLVVNGVPISFAIGECNYIPSNSMMSYADACEGAKSNSLARCCKLIGMTLELWDKEWADKWKAQYATKNGGDWVKKSAAPAKPKNLEPAVVIANVKREWKSAAIAKGMVKDDKDTKGLAALATLLGDLYTGLTYENAAANRGEGIKRIDDWMATP
jgi:hypothetical protein